MAWLIYGKSGIHSRRMGECNDRDQQNQKQLKRSYNVEGARKKCIAIFAVLQRIQIILPKILQCDKTMCRDAHTNLLLRLTIQF